MFESRFIDRFSRTHWAVVPILFLPAIAGLLYWGLARAGVSVAAAFATVLLGIFAWTLAEYWLHRTLFHWEPGGKFGERMHFILHGVHHKWPRDQFRLVMPPAVSISLFWLFLGLWMWLLGPFAFTFHAGFTAGYVFYDLSHYYMHHGRPRWEWLKELRKHHMVHHSPNLAREQKFGVSTTLWDHVFRTFGRREA